MKHNQINREISRQVYFVIGTRAQFIKVSPLMRKMLDAGYQYRLIYTAQHRENIDEILAVYRLPPPDVVMYQRTEANTISSFLPWFLTILWKALFRAKEYLPQPGWVLTHGDTHTAWLAALMGKSAGCVVGHIESGCRSYNIFSPFPEEINRLITFSLTDVYFCADEWGIHNLRHHKGLKVMLGANTMLDGVRYALAYQRGDSLEPIAKPYGVVSIHRFENIFTGRLTKVIIPLLKDIARTHRLVLTLHPSTRERLVRLNLYDDLCSTENIVVHTRFDFVDWINLCDQAEFVITDGGSNQEELSYLGIPTLLFRYETERREGLGQNVVISHFDEAVIKQFLANPQLYKREPSLGSAEPSESIIKVICPG